MSPAAAGVPGVDAAIHDGRPMPPALPVSLAGRVVFVVGGGSVAPGVGIGRAACITYARLGARVGVADRDRDAAEATAAAIRALGGHACTFVGDMAVEADIVRVFAEATEQMGPVDALHHNVGIGKTGGALQTAAADLDHAHAVNLRSLLVACQQVLPGMLQRRRGAIVTVSSVAALRYLGYPHLAYGTTKAAVAHFTRLLALEHAGQGVRANCVVPGLIDTPRIASTVAGRFAADLGEARAARDRQVPMGRMGTAWEVADACAFLLSDAASYITGTELCVDGGLTGKFV